MGPIDPDGDAEPVYLARPDRPMVLWALVPWNGNFFRNSRALSPVAYVAYQLNTSVYSPSSRLAGERNCLPNNETYYRSRGLEIRGSAL